MRGGANEIYTRVGSCVDKLATYRGWIACVFGMHSDIWCLCSQLLAKSMSSATILTIYLQCFQFSPLPLNFSILLLQYSLLSFNFSILLLQLSLCLCPLWACGLWCTSLRLYSQWWLPSIFPGDLRTESSAFTRCFDQINTWLMFDIKICLYMYI